MINHVDRLNGEPGARPQTYWINTSGNDFVKRFIDKANKTTRDEIERLVAGEAIEKMVRLELTYDEIDNSIDNMWSVLFTTGYLTQTGMTEQGAYKLVIPNKEVREVYKFQIQEWFKKSVFSNTEQLTAFWNGVEEGNTEAIEKYLNRILSNSISVFDTKAPDKESSYHTLLVGLLGCIQLFCREMNDGTAFCYNFSIKRNPCLIASRIITNKSLFSWNFVKASQPG